MKNLYSLIILGGEENNKGKSHTPSQFMRIHISNSSHHRCGSLAVKATFFSKTHHTYDAKTCSFQPHQRAVDNRTRVRFRV